MTIPVYSLGTFDFVSLNSLSGPDGAPWLPQRQSEEIRRPNVKGVGFVRFERQGMLFPMESFVDVANDAAASLLIANYHLAVMTDPLEIVWRDINFFSEYGVKYVIRFVTDIRCRRVQASAGGLSAGGTVVKAIWHLVPVEVEA